MRLMILTADYPPHNWSGIGVTVERQARALVALGLEVHVLVASETELELPGATEQEPIVHHLSRQHCPVDPRRFDLVHLHSLALSEFALELRRRFGLPLVYTTHSLLHLELENTPQAREWCAVQARMLAWSDWVILLSASERMQAIELVPDLAQRSSVIPNGVLPPPNPLPPPPLAGPVVFAGRFARNKGVELLAGLVPCILARHRCQFVLAGGHGDVSGQRVVSELVRHFRKNCEVAGWLAQDDLEKLFARSVLVLVPSLYEPFGQTALEAMRVGAPVLAAAVGGLVDIVDGESGGRTVNSRDPEDWSEAALEIISNPEISQELRRRGPGYVADRFNISRIAQRLRDEVYAG